MVDAKVRYLVFFLFVVVGVFLPGAAAVRAPFLWFGAVAGRFSRTQPFLARDTPKRLHVFPSHDRAVRSDTR
jgi:hypothetical protein